MWGSFLNMVGYRLVSGDSLLTSRSFCPNCKSIIAWYDNIPVFSWIILGRKCRNCLQSISYLYPLIEILSVVIFSLLILLISPQYWFAYAIFFSALIITIRTDLQAMLIFPYVTIALIPFALVCSYFSLLPLSLFQSFLGAISGYLFLICFDKIFYLLTHKQGMGLGDIELLACIGAFLGVHGWLVSLLIGSFVGSIFGLTQTMQIGSFNIKIPFGPFLALGALIVVFLQAFTIDIFDLFLMY